MFQNDLWHTMTLRFMLILLAGNLLLAGAEPALRQMKYSSRPKPQTVLWQKDLRAKLFGTLHLTDLVTREQAVPFAAKVMATTRHETFTEKEIELNSTPGRRIKIILTLPHSADGPFPAVVCIHGHGGNRRVVYDSSTIYKGFATALASRNCVTISTDVGQHDVREPGRLLMGERLWDVMRCVDYLESLAEVDRARIGCAGLSLGGEMTMWLGAMDTRLRATVSSGFLTVMDQMEQKHCLCWKFDGLRELVDYADIYSLIAPRALQCQNGLKEGPTQFFVPIARKAMQEINVIYADLDQSDNAALRVHEGAHEIDLPSLLAFFEKHLSVAKSR